jgi:hypothetical protein
MPIAGLSTVRCGRVTHIGPRQYIDSPGFSSGLFMWRFEVPEKRRGLVVFATLPVANCHVTALVMPMPGVTLALRDAGRFRPLVPRVHLARLASRPSRGRARRLRGPLAFGLELFSVGRAPTVTTSRGERWNRIPRIFHVSIGRFRDSFMRRTSRKVIGTAGKPRVSCTFLDGRKMRAALGEGRPRAYRSGDGVGGVRDRSRNRKS